MDKNIHFRIVHGLKMVMLSAFIANLFRIVYRTVKYGGSTETHTHTFNFDDGMGDVDGVFAEEDDDVG